MATVEYKYLRVRTEYVDDKLQSYAVEGWTVHTLNRNHNSSIVDILLERVNDSL